MISCSRWSGAKSPIDGNAIWSSLKSGPARPGHAKIVLDITADEFDQFSLYSTGTMTIKGQTLAPLNLG